MTQVDFYGLPQPGIKARLGFACRLAEKAYKLQHKVHVYVSDSKTAAEFDDLLWTFRDDSFVPHEQLGVGEPTGAPVTVSCGEDLPANCELLINLTDDTPDFADSFPRIAELVSSDVESKTHGRRRYAAYRKKGCELAYHDIG